MQVLDARVVVTVPPAPLQPQTKDSPDAKQDLKGENMACISATWTERPSSCKLPGSLGNCSYGCLGLFNLLVTGT